MELVRGEVDGDVGRGVLGILRSPGAGGRDGLAHREGAQFEDQVALLGEWDEHYGRD